MTTVDKKIIVKPANNLKKSVKVERAKLVLDAGGQIMGRLATQIATFLQGKHKPSYQTYLDLGDFVEVTNVAKIKVSGKKMTDKPYYHHSGYPGGLKKKLMKELTPAQQLIHAVHNMLPKNKLRTARMKRLKIT